MNNEDENQLAMLLNNGVWMEVVANDGGIFQTYSYTFTIFIREIQEFMTGCDNLDDFDGIHQFDEESYVGIGNSVKKAWDDFLSKNTGSSRREYVNYSPDIADSFSSVENYGLAIPHYIEQVIKWEQLPQEDKMLKR
jgi:hypothetical protein